MGIRLASFWVALVVLPLFALDLHEEFFAAARRGDTSRIRQLLARGVDVNAKWRYDTTALMMAARNGHAEAVKLLLDHGANVNAKDNYYEVGTVGSALFKNSVPVVKLLLERGAPGGDEALLAGVADNNLELVKVALNLGHPSSDAKSRGLTRALRANRPEIAALLQQAGATPLPEPNFAVDPQLLQQYAGTYLDERGAEVTFKVDGGKLVTTFGGQRQVLAAVDSVTFQSLQMDMISVIFHLEEGKAVAMTVKEGDAATEFTRVEGK